MREPVSTLHDVVLTPLGPVDGLRFAKADRGQLAPRDLSRDQPIVSVVVPTRNEADNVSELVSRVTHVATHLPIQLIVVDDSSDHTPRVIEEISGSLRHRIVVVHRSPDKRGDGLGGAVLLGLRTARAPWVCVMDADLQHPPELIPRLLDEAVRSGADVVVASRYRPGGDAGCLSVLRAAISRGTCAVARLCFPHHLRNVTDPMSGFFLVRRDAIELSHLRPSGFKVLLEILVRTPGLQITEIPFRFEPRRAGRSKVTLGEGVRFVRLLANLRFNAGERPSLASSWSALRG